MASDYYDLDAALDAMSPEPIKVVIRGTKLEFRPQVSTHVVLRLVKMAEQEDISEDIESLMEFWRYLFGADNFKTMVDTIGLSIPEMTAVQEHLLRQYGLVTKDEEDASTEKNPQ